MRRRSFRPERPRRRVKFLAQAARTAGATCATTIFSLFSIASQTFSVSSRSERANRTVGDTLTAEAQFASPIVLCPATFTVVLEPVPSIPDPESLDLITDLNTAHALDALRGITDQREILIHG